MPDWNEVSETIFPYFFTRSLSYGLDTKYRLLSKNICLKKRDVKILEFFFMVWWREFFSLHIFSNMEMEQKP